MNTEWFLSMRLENSGADLVHIMDFKEAIIKEEMKDIYRNFKETNYPNKEDDKYYKKLCKAAKTIHNFYSVEGEKL